MTATEAEQNRRKGLTPWWRTRSWGRDLDALTRLHKGLLALDVSGDAAPQPLSAPTLVAPPDGEAAAPEDLQTAGPDPEQTDADGEPGPAVPDDRTDLAETDVGETDAAETDVGEADVAETDLGGADVGEADLGEAGPPETAEPHEGADRPAALPRRAANQNPLTGRPRPAGADEAEPEPGEQPEGGTPPQAATPPPAATTPAATTPQAATADAAGPDPAIAAIKDTFRYVAEAGDNAVGYFYGQLFARQPRLRELFPPAMDEQRDRLFHALGRIVESLSTPEEMAAYLSQLGRDHRKYRVEPYMYEAVGAALLATLRSFARDAFTAGAEEAWTQVYAAGSSIMIKAAEDDAASGPAAWPAEVVQVDHRADDIAVLTVAPDQPLLFEAGQHISVQTPRWPRVWRSYSIASRPREDGLLTLHVKAIPGGWVSTALVRHTPPGTELLLGPPLGTMTLDHAADRDLLCVAGGTGLAPVKSIVEQAVRQSAASPRRIYLFCGARRREGLYDLPDLWRLEDAYHGFQLIPVASDDPAFDGMQGNVGRVAARYMPHTDCEAYVAGPPEMVRETIRVLAKAGLEHEHIHFDDALLAGRGASAGG